MFRSTRALIGRPCAAHGLLMGYPWATHGLSMDMPMGMPMCVPWAFSQYCRKRWRPPTDEATHHNRRMEALRIQSRLHNARGEGYALMSSVVAFKRQGPARCICSPLAPLFWSIKYNRRKAHRSPSAYSRRCSWSSCADIRGRSPLHIQHSLGAHVGDKGVHR